MWLMLGCAVQEVPLAPEEFRGEDARWEQHGVQRCDAQQGPPTDISPWGVQPQGPFSPVGAGVAVADLDADGLQDVVVINDRALEVWFGGETQPVVLSDDVDLEAIAVVDLNGDGDLDLDTAGIYQRRVFYNDGTGDFAQDVVSEDVVTSSVSWSDMDGDRRLDRLVGALGHLSHQQLMSGDFPVGHPNRVELAAGGLLDLPDEAIDGFSYSFVSLDANGDGIRDLYAVNDFGPQVVGNRLMTAPDWRCEPSASFDGYGMGLAIGDLNHDGLPELFFTGWRNNGLLANDGSGRYYDASGAMGLACVLNDEHVGWGADFGDIDNDGDLDLLVGFGKLHVPEDVVSADENPDQQYDVLLLNDDGVFRDVSAEWGLDAPGPTRGVLLEDVDGDGFVEVVRSDLTGRGQVLSAGCNDNAWLVVEPRQDNHNPFAVDAVVEVIGDETVWTRTIRAGGRSLGSSSGPQAHFGLGDVDEVTVRITWPDGAVSQSTVPTRQRITVHRR